MNKLTVAVILFLTATLPGSAQKIVPSPADLYADALEYVFAGDYPEALAVFLNLQERGFVTANISYKIGECYLNIQGQKTKAIPYLKEAVQKISATWSGKQLEEEYAPVTSLLYLGIAYRLNNDFKNALDCLNKYLNSLDDVDKENIALAEYHIQRCNYARELMASPAIFTADTLPENINTPESNFRPMVTSDEKILYFMNQLKFYDAVMQTVKADTAWQTPENLTPDIRSDGDHYITGISADGSRLFLTSYDPYRSGEIYTTEYRNGRWGEMIRLNDNINTMFNESHASLSPEGQSLYFTSDRKGGFGGLDIYRSSLTSTGEWGPAVNLGPFINSPYNEESPFISSDSRRLFFSSQGHYNMGGYDVFMSAKDADGKWLPPVNIGYPLNTTDDDLFFFPVGLGNTAYQARFSPYTAKQDILRFAISSYGNPARFTLHGKISLQVDPGYDPGNISMAVIDRNAGDTVGVQRLQQDGSFSQKLPGGAFSLDFSDESGSLLKRELDIPVYFPNDELILNGEITIHKKLVNDTLFLKAIRFAFDKSLLDEQYLGYLDGILKIMTKYPDPTLQINGYADSQGKESYNLKLSLLRARSVEAYLKSKEEINGRITVSAFGEKNPVAVNLNADGTDNPQGRGYNRRVELVFSNNPGELVIKWFQDIPENLLYK